MIAPPGQTTLTVTDTHGSPLPQSIWYTLPITGTSAGMTETLQLGLLIGGEQRFLPVLPHNP